MDGPARVPEFYGTNSPRGTITGGRSPERSSVFGTEQMLEPIDPRRRIVEQLGFFVGRISGGEALEGIPEDVVAAGHPVNREV